MKKAVNINPARRPYPYTTVQTRFSIWWLRNFESIIHFWTGFGWVWAFAVLLSAIVGYMPLVNALAVLFFTGIVALFGILLCIRSISTHLKSLEDGPEKEEAHELMIQIIKRRIRKI